MNPPIRSFDWSQSYPSVRRPVFARRVVATSHPLAAQAGLGMIACTAILLSVWLPSIRKLRDRTFAREADGRRGYQVSDLTPAFGCPVSPLRGDAGIPAGRWPNAGVRSET